MENRFDIRSASLTEVVAWLRDTLGEPDYRGEQVWRWAHRHGVRDFDEMKNISKDLRATLKARAHLGSVEVDMVQRSTDGTKKMRLRTHDGRFIESVLIPDGEKMTQCISSQVGCALGCDFCATAKMGFIRHLSSGEIVDQVYLAQKLLAEEDGGRRISNLVYMGMGEPLHNFDSVTQSIKILTEELGANMSYRRITVSTVGLVTGIEKLAKEERRPNLAISLNASNDLVRSEIMPVNKRFNIQKLLDTLRAFPLEKRRRITFEYVLLAGVNDSVEDAARVAKLLRGIPSKLNIIPWNPHEGAAYKRPSKDAIRIFQEEAKRCGVPTYLRTPRGDDIAAACGQLANDKNKANGKLNIIDAN